MIWGRMIRGRMIRGRMIRGRMIRGRMIRGAMPDGQLLGPGEFRGIETFGEFRYAIHLIVVPQP